MASQNELYQSITDRIIDALERGTAPWIKPWRADGSHGGMPHNAVSGRAYHGINVLLLAMQEQACGYASPHWLTFKQATERGGHVRAGEKGTQIVFWRFMTRDAKDAAGNPVRGDDGKTVQRTVPMLKTFYVFNVAQCDDLELPVRKVREPIAPTAIDGLVAQTGATVKHGGDRAYYTAAGDYIGMPQREAFRDLGHYHGTLLHELTHWTSHAARCNRELGKRFGDEAYAAEELIAEMGSAFLCASLGVPLDGLQHPSYIASWLRVLRSDNRAIFTAAKAAQCAADYLLAAMGMGEPADDEAIEPTAAQLEIAA